MRKDRATPRGRTRRSWETMRRRCVVPHASDYPNYGGRGIKVCNRWLDSFENFLADMGLRPEGTTLDRIDNNGDYEPTNCRWADDFQQQRNKRSNRILEFNGLRLTTTEWANRIGIKKSALRMRLDSSGWSIERALLTPPAPNTRHAK